MEEINHPYLTKAYIRQLADSQSFQRGINYFEGKAISNAFRQGLTLGGYSLGSRIEPYRVQVLLGEKGLQEASCTCPRGGFCKHIVALLLTYIHKPDTFRDIFSLKEQLSALDQEELVNLVLEMIQRDISLLAMVERRAMNLSGAEIDVTLLRRDVQRALQHDDPYDIEVELGDLLQIADNMAEKEDWLGAGTVYKEILRGLASGYDEDLMNVDEDGDIALVALASTEGLQECFDALENDGTVPKDWLKALFEILLAEIKLGGIDLSGDAHEIILNNASEEEWSLLEKELRELIPEKEGWSRKYMVNMLADWYERRGQKDEAVEVIRGLGTREQVLFLLVREGKPKEAVKLAKENFLESPRIIIDLAQALSRMGAEEYGINLLKDLANSESSYPSYLEWLANHYYGKGDFQRALKWQKEVSVKAPGLKSYMFLHEIGNKLGEWEKVRSEVLEELLKKSALVDLLDIALYEGDIDRALELLSQVRHGGWRNYKLEIAKAAEEKKPEEAIRLYQEMVESAISIRQRKHYSRAAEYLIQLKKLYDYIGKPKDWVKYINGIKSKYARLPALQDEIRVTGL